MDKLYSFNFESRTWTMRHCKRLLPSWTFGHAVRRKRSIFAYGSVQGDFGTLEVHQSYKLSRQKITADATVLAQGRLFPHA